MSRARVHQLNKWEIRILRCIKARSQTEKKIARKIGIDISIVSPLITELMLKGYVEIITKRRLRFLRKRYCALTPEGLEALEENGGNSLDAMILQIRERMLGMVAGARKNSPLFNATWLVATAGYKTAKFVLNR